MESTIKGKMHYPCACFQSYNLGTGRGVSVMELIKAFELTNNVQVPFVIEQRRQGDISTMFADS